MIVGPHIPFNPPRMKGVPFLNPICFSRHSQTFLPWLHRFGPGYRFSSEYSCCMAAMLVPRTVGVSIHITGRLSGKELSASIKAPSGIRSFPRERRGHITHTCWCPPSFHCVRCVPLSLMMRCVAPPACFPFSRLSANQALRVQSPTYKLGPRASGAHLPSMSNPARGRSVSSSLEVGEGGAVGTAASRAATLSGVRPDAAPKTRFMTFWH